MSPAPTTLVDAARVDLACALRAADDHGFGEGVCNHFSLALGDGTFLINPQGLAWREITPEDLVTIDAQGRRIAGRHPVEPTAFFIHGWIHRVAPQATCVLHTHMPYATALTLVEGGRLEWCNQNALRFFGRVAYDDVYNGLALDAAEGDRIAARLDGGQDVMFMASHGVTVVGRSLAWAFDDLYYLERACMHQVLAVQAAAGRPLRRVPDALCARVASQVDGERQQSDLFFEATKRLLDRDARGWRAL